MLEEIRNYVENRDKLDAALSSGFGLASSYSGRVGIINQGSTCYLNSLIQCLFYNLPFRILILQAKPESAIIAALQALFAQLQLSAAPAVTTKDLVTAFGWSRGQVFEQHDVHELFSLLLDALGDASTDLGTQLSDLFRGSMTDILLCPSCGYRRESVSTFLNISLELSSHSGNDADEFEVREKRVDLSKLLELHMQTETLDADNKWQCSGCSERVHAVKYPEYSSLPPSLMIHLKRFRYNTVLNKREKVTTPVYFPSVLDASVLTHPAAEGARTGKTVSTDKLSGSATATGANGEEGEEGKEGDTDDKGEKVEGLVEGENGEKVLQEGKGAKYRLHSILLHTGTANGGHYKAYVIDASTGRWLECNDSSVCELTQREEASLSLQRASMARPPPPLSAGPSEKVTHAVDAPSDSYPPLKKTFSMRDDVLRENAYMLLYRRITDSSTDIEGEGGVGGTEIEKGVEREQVGDSAQRKAEASMMVESCIAAIPLPLKEAIREKNIEMNELRRLYEVHKKVLTVKVTYDPIEIEAVKRTVLEEAKGEGGKPGHVTLTLLNTDTLNDLLSQVCSLLAVPFPLPPSDSLSPVTGEEGEEVGEGVLPLVKPHPHYRLRAFDERTGRRGETYGQRGEESMASLRLKTPQSFPVVLRFESRREEDKPFLEMSDSDMYVRVIVWSEEVSQVYINFAASYGARFDVLAVTTDIDSSEVTSTADIDASVTTNEREETGPRTADSRAFKTVILAATHNLLIPGEASATLGALRQAMSTLLSRPLADILLIFKSDRTVLELDPDQDHRSLGKAYGIKPFDVIFTEVRSSSDTRSDGGGGVGVGGGENGSSGEERVDGDDEPSEQVAVKSTSKALLALQRLSNSITIKFNNPRYQGNNAESDINSNVTHEAVLAIEHTLKVTSDFLLKELKVLLAETLGIDSKKEEFYLCRSSAEFSPQYKDESKSLSDLGLGDMSSVYLKMGRGCLLGEHLLRFELEVPASVCGAVEEAVRTLTLTAAPPRSIGSTNSSTSSIGDDSVDGGNGNAEGAPKGRTKLIPFGELIVREQSTVLTLKETLLSSWREMSTWTENSIPERPLTVHHLRLRDAKTVSKTSLGPLLRNERLLSRCLLGLADGRRLIVQMLAEPQVISPSDWILGVRLATYSSSKSLPSSSVSSASSSQEVKEDEGAPGEEEKEEGEKDSHGDVRVSPHNEFSVKKVHRVLDLPVSRTASVRDLYRDILLLFPHLTEPHLHSEVITSPSPSSSPTDTDSSDTPHTPHSPDDEEKSVGAFPEVDILSVAKGFVTGPPLTLKSSRKLAWNPSTLVSSPDMQVDHPSVGLRDGMLLVVRGEADWARAAKETAPVGDEAAEEEKGSAARSRVVSLPAWKVRSNPMKKSSGGSTTVLGVGLQGRTRTVPTSCSGRGPEKGLSLGPSACSRQATLMQSALALDSSVNQDPGSPIPELRREAEGVCAVRSADSTHPDLAPPVPDIDHISLPAASDDAKNVPQEECSQGQRMPVAPVEVVRALKEGSP